MVTGCTGAGSDSPEHEPTKRITEGKFAPKLSVKSRYTNMNKDLSELGPYIPATILSNYMHVIPNSHFWTDLTQIAYLIQHDLDRQKRETEVKDSRSICVDEPLNREYFITGLNNSIKNGYNLKRNKNRSKSFKIKLTSSHFIIFESIESMIEYVQSERFNLKGFSDIINNTINVGFNLTNGIKMERTDVYKRIDAERKYQDIVGKSGQRGDTLDEEKPVAEWLNYIEYHLSKAKDYVYHLQKDHALDELRKVAALAVRAMEIHGCPERRMPDSIGGVKVNIYDYSREGKNVAISSKGAIKGVMHCVRNCGDKK